MNNPIKTLKDKISLIRQKMKGQYKSAKSGKFVSHEDAFDDRDTTYKLGRKSK